MTPKLLPIAIVAALLPMPACSRPQTVERQLFTHPLDVQEIAKFPHNCLVSKTTFIREDPKKHGNELEWQRFKGLYKDGDELWSWEGALQIPDRKDFPKGAVSIGLCLIRNNKVFAVFSLGTLAVI